MLRTEILKRAWAVVTSKAKRKKKKARYVKISDALAHIVEFVMNVEVT